MPRRPPAAALLEDKFLFAAASDLTMTLNFHPTYLIAILQRGRSERRLARFMLSESKMLCHIKQWSSSSFACRVGMLSIIVLNSTRPSASMPANLQEF